MRYDIAQKHYLYIYILILTTLFVTSVSFKIKREKSNINIRNDYVKKDFNNIDKIHKLTFAIKQNNINELKRLLLAVSDPKSNQYGNYLTNQEIGTF